MGIVNAIRSCVALDLHITGVVKEVDIATVTLSVLPDDGGEMLSKVRMRAVNVSNDLGCFAIPTVGSVVLVAFVDGDRNLPYLLATSEVEGLILKKESGLCVAVGSDDKIVVSGVKEAVFSVLGNVAVDCEGAVVKCSKSASLTAKTAEIKADSVSVDAAKIDLGKNGSGVVTNKLMPVCFVTGAPIPCSASVLASV